jgi:formate hydrogenlyase subunit 3/multisubunit Na+/H+ antiporter MnhD subunit
MNMFGYIKKIYTYLRSSAASVKYSLYEATFVPITQDDGSPFAQIINQDDLSLAQFLNAAFKIALGIAAMIAVARVLYAGFRYMTSTVPHAKEQSKKILREAVLGILILISIVLVLGYINPNILKLDFELKPLTDQEQPAQQ